MSKPDSGLFTNTNGLDDFYGDAESVIAARVVGLDLREHPLTRKQLSSKKNKKIREKIKSRTATKEEYKHYMWNKRLKSRRQAGIDLFWTQEKRRILNNKKTTRKWSNKQKEEILAGNKPKYNGKTIQAHHSYSVLKYPHLANAAEIMYPATYYEHFKGWHGSNYRNSLPGKRIRRIQEF